MPDVMADRRVNPRFPLILVDGNRSRERHETQRSNLRRFSHWVLH
jgi:hypothetical protein